ncbi:MAG: hypothetical protein JWP64_3696 [Pseudonocardia sp.]|jgi:hypothetical protein|nr:hypothetical protein [Pseudonocardia sp.]
MYVPRFAVRQRITMMVNRYEIRALAPDGTEGGLLAFAQQKRMTFKEQVTFYADEAKSPAVFSFKARQRLDVRAENDVFDESGNPLGMFRKDFAKSCSAPRGWHLSAPGIEAVGQERRAGIAVLRRVWDVLPIVGDIPVPFLFHFDFVDANGATVLTSERQRSVRDRYTITVPDPRLDFRVAASMAVALDAFQGR